MLQSKAEASVPLVANCKNINTRCEVGKITQLVALHMLRWFLPHIRQG